MFGGGWDKNPLMIDVSIDKFSFLSAYDVQCETTSTTLPPAPLLGQIPWPSLPLSAILFLLRPSHKSFPTCMTQLQSQHWHHRAFFSVRTTCFLLRAAQTTVKPFVIELCLVWHDCLEISTAVIIQSRPSHYWLMSLLPGKGREGSWGIN